jgi:5-(carboxyamino)imidazole ribonucleotide synthase
MPIVGVIGGGQLARMMQPAAINLGITLRVFAEDENSSAHLGAYRVGDYLNLAALKEFCVGLDALTFDHEHVPASLLEALESAGIAVRPGSKALIHAQNKLTMRRKLADLGLPMPAWMAATTAAEVDQFIANHGPEIVVKTPIGGYDGKGVRVISSVTEVADWLADIQDYGSELLLEQKVDFVGECAQLSARTPSGEFKTWPLVRTIQRHGVCSEVIAPFGSPAQQIAAEKLAKTISEGLGVVGVLAVELFETASGELLINELAMRPHNSGHFSIEGSKTSQFEQHLRAVLDLPLGATELVDQAAVMINLLGVDDSNSFVEHYPEAMALAPEVKFHLYEKTPRKGRKMGHITLVGPDSAELLKQGQAAREVLYRGSKEAK